MPQRPSCALTVRPLDSSSGAAPASGWEGDCVAAPVCVCSVVAEADGLGVEAIVAVFCPEAIPGTDRQAPTVTEASG